MREKDITYLINRCLAHYGENVKRFRPVPGIWGARSIDYIGSAFGYAFAIEAKRPGEKPRDIQHIELHEWQQAGTAVFIINSVEDIGALESWLRFVCRYPITGQPSLPEPNLRVLQSKGNAE